MKFASNPETLTDVVKGSFDPVWNDKIELPVRTPTMADVIIMQLRDWDPVKIITFPKPNVTFKKDGFEIISTCFLKYSEVVAKKPDWSQPRWINFYGCPTDRSTSKLSIDGNLAIDMNKGIKPGSAFRGRALVALTDSLQPSAKVFEINLKVFE